VEYLEIALGGIFRDMVIHDFVWRRFWFSNEEIVLVKQAFGGAMVD